MAKAKFVVRKGTTGKFRFNLIGTNGKIIANERALQLQSVGPEGHRGGEAPCARS